MNSRVLWFAVLAAATAIVCGLFAQTTSPAPFTYDEADYMYAASQGFAANYLDRGSIGFVAYLEKGLELRRDKSQRQGMSQFVRNSGDLGFYRHYHGPVYACWLAVWHALGVQRESTYRATGLVLHALGTLIVFFMFRRVFPELPVQGAFVAALVFAMNRTALVAATMITQHVMFSFLACCALFAVAEFLRSGQDRYWYAGTALLAAAFATVEIAIVLIGTVVLTVIVFEWRQGFRKLASLFARGTLSFIVALAIVWPPGLFKLNAIKGYLYLAYMAIARKTFTPIGPVELWGTEIRSHPLEFVLLLFVMIAGALWLWKTESFRSVAPFLAYGIAFFCATLVITLPYTYYHASLTMALAVVTGVLCGEVWNRTNDLNRYAAVVVIAASLVGLDIGYYRETVLSSSAKPTGTADVLTYLNMHPATGVLVVPHDMVPALHYYWPGLVSNGYDDTATSDALLQQLSGLDRQAEIFCDASVCPRLDPGGKASLEQIGTTAITNRPLYVMHPAAR